jgi:hypothetical protein
MNTSGLAVVRPLRKLASISVILSALAVYFGPWQSAAAEDSAVSATAVVELDPAALAERIDQHLAVRWKADKIEPAPAADDAEFLRRVYLDLAGKIPSVAEARVFLDDHDPQKRRKLVDHLLDQATFPAHFGRTLRDLMAPGATNNLQLQFLMPQFEAWLRLRLAADTPYDKLVGELLTFSSGAAPNIRANPFGGEPSPAVFYQFNEQRPENLAASTARIFLGVQVECAQCHNHPFARWKREEFWGFAAFFSAAGQQQNVFAPVADSSDRRGIQIPGTTTTVEPRLLDGSPPAWESGATKRATLARWVTAAENPLFARATANRLWWHFFGRGLVDPVDDMDEVNPPSHPEILDELARQLVYHQFDVKFLIRTITATQAYQLSSQTTHASQDDPQQFARMPLRSMTADQLIESLAQAAGLEPQPQNVRGAIVNPTGGRSQFMTRFADSGPSRTDYQATILQALTLMNGQLIADATSLTRSENLQAIVEAPFLDTPGRIETLFLATLTRRPSPDELATMQAHVDAADSADGRKQALADVFWALLNSAEFVLNH